MPTERQTAVEPLLRLPRDLDELHRQAVAIALRHGGWAAKDEMEILFARVLSEPADA